MTRFILVIVFLFLSACATITSQPKDHSILSPQSCLAFYSEFDAFIDDEDIRDVQATLVPDFPFLSINRFLDSFKFELDSDEKLDYWLLQLADLNIEARQVEWKNLSRSSQEKLLNNFTFTQSLSQYVSECSSLLLTELSEDDKRQVISSVKVKDDYSAAQRFFGVYPLTSLFVSRQINKHQELAKKSFEKSLSEIPVKGRLVRYSMSSEIQSDKIEFDRKNPLNIPVVDDEALDQLFIQHAPIIEVDEEDGNDVIGKIGLDDKGYPKFSNEQSVFYVLPSYTKFNDEVLLQLNYVFWFSSRPRKSTFDIYSGRLDGLIWRVTLDPSGEPIVYDSVHNCGCYHKFFLTDKILLNEDVASQEREPPFVAQKNVNFKAGSQLVLRVGSVAHFLNRVYVADALGETKNIDIKAYANLRSLNWNGKRRSLFANDGLVKGTARAERWLLWPMGVPSAGAMRQWGHHAVAFVGKRYFDDSNLLDKYFTIKP